MSKQRQPDYLSYLLRLWQAGSQFEANQEVWRASLESPHTGERWSFASLNDLFDFLQLQTGHPSHKVQVIEQPALNQSRQ